MTGDLETRLAAVETFIEQQKVIRGKAIAQARAEDAARQAEFEAVQAEQDAIRARAAEHTARRELFKHLLTLEEVE